jgi:hypothetical protein
MYSEENEEHIDPIIRGFRKTFVSPPVSPPQPSGEEILSVALRWFNQNNWPFTQIEGQPMVRIHFQGKNGEWICYAEARETQYQFLFYSVMPMKVPESKRMAVAELITRANYGLSLGNFELDLNDGEVRYKTSIDVQGSTLDMALIEHLVYANVLTMDRYFPGIMQVNYGDISPAEAIASVEG